jgi:oligopeptide/dipeptide ABC transporter ATP-binding protein
MSDNAPSPPNVGQALIVSESPSANVGGGVGDGALHLSAPLLQVQDLRVTFFTPAGPVDVLQGVNLAVNPGEILGVVGESGSGKSVMALSVMRLLRRPGRVTDGQILFRGTDLLTLAPGEMRGIRGEEISMIFQNPRSSLNPVFRVGKVLREVLRVHEGLRGEEANRRAATLLADVGLPDPASILSSFPHQLSGGMAQRVMIALALASSPRLLIADEPTTALDVTIQYQIITLLKRLREVRGLAQIVITHNLGVVAELCDRVAVMYAGTIVEEGPTLAIFDEPRHPYTRGLLAARARTETVGALANIPGQVPDLRRRPPGCPFHPRCAFAIDVCAETVPPLEDAGDRHRVACHRWREIA